MYGTTVLRIHTSNIVTKKIEKCFAGIWFSRKPPQLSDATDAIDHGLSDDDANRCLSSFWTKASPELCSPLLPSLSSVPDNWRDAVLSAILDRLSAVVVGAHLVYTRHCAMRKE